MECFLAPGSFNASLLGERLLWLALAASSSQRGFLSSGRQLDFGQRLGVTGMSLTTARWYFSPDAVCLVHSHHPCTSLLHNCCVLTSGVGAALHPDVEVCPQQQVMSCAFTSLTPPSHGHKRRADAVFTARHPECFVQPLNPKSAQNPPLRTSPAVPHGTFLGPSRSRRNNTEYWIHLRIWPRKGAGYFGVCWSSAFSSGLDPWGASGYLCAGLEGFLFTANTDTRVFQYLLVKIQFCRVLW